MVYPKIHHMRHFLKGVMGLGMIYFYAYNFSRLSLNIRLKTVRNVFPFVVFAGFSKVYRYARSDA